MNKKDLLRKLPKMDDLLKEEIVINSLKAVMRPIVIEALRETLEEFRNRILNDNITEFTTIDILEGFKQLVKQKNSPNLKKVINGTGVILHTNLGRALLGEEALRHIINCADSYSNLEYDLKSGERGSRYEHVEELIKKITGAEAAVVVNNNAAAVMLVLNTLCSNKEAIVSRGQLVEIGGSFRVPEVMKFSNATLVEVGTTNRTHLYDYVNSITENTGVLLKVHTSNFKIMGFTEEVPLEDLVSLGKEKSIPVVEDIGSGVLVDFSKYGFSYEPTVQESIKKGIDVVTFSGDKMLGGPQAGIIAGKKIYIDKIKRNQLTRALRIDKLTLAALEGTLKYYMDETKAVAEIPTLNMILSSKDIHKKRAQRLKNRILKAAKEIDINIASDYSMVGGGSMPAEKIPTYVLRIKSDFKAAKQIEASLRNYVIPIIVRIFEDNVIIDLRTIFDKDFDIIALAFKNLMQQKG
ncbi:L-seryl-tRNA(Sec) selenium transferase [Candidatus Clostridium stratigraminis]|uniref:L-seryl-tRNA(Sec) selenium transferase n=1 Tax=Candidatus Clostridium stratigraminis TaxID=3381661 RepID=A0ABW8T8R5_9CLOT